MPRKPIRKRITKIPAMTDEQCGWLYDRGEKYTWLFFMDDNELRHLWETYRDKVMTWWTQNKPCTRPVRWWEYDAPRWKNDPFEGWYIHGTLPEPRQRIGGTGTPSYEVLAYVPDFDKGIPESWVSKFDEEYYSGRRKDIHGNPIGTNHKDGDFKGVAIDPNDPPIYESEAAYLKRHKLLTAEEKIFLKTHPDLLEPEKVIFED